MRHSRPIENYISLTINAFRETPACPLTRRVLLSVGRAIAGQHLNPNSQAAKGLE